MARVPLVVRVSILVIFALLIHKGVEAQVPDDGPSSVGFANPDRVQPVRAYRLPTWHWSMWTLRANGNASRSFRNREYPDSRSDREVDQYNLGLRLNPVYRSFWESESRRAFLQLSPSLDFSRRRATSITEGQEQDHDDMAVSAQFDLRGRLREYVSGQTFLLASVDGSAVYNYQRVLDDGRVDTQHYLDGRTTVRLGVGVGRVRIVTPVIRALRMQERLQSVSPGMSVSDDQVQAAAHQLARRPGYSAVYDRPDKYFWRDFFERAGLSGRGPFETFYVADILRERVGVRREGAEIAVGALGSHEGGEDGGSGRVLTSGEIYGDAVGGFARGQWYRNLTLNHQLGMEGRADYVNFLEDPVRPDRHLRLSAEAQWLWVLANRLRINTRLRANFLHWNDREGEETFQQMNDYLLSTDLVIFVENSLVLRAGANVRYDSRDRGSEFRTGLQFRVNYHLSRALR